MAPENPRQGYVTAQAQVCHIGGSIPNKISKVAFLNLQN